MKAQNALVDVGVGFLKNPEHCIVLIHLNLIVKSEIFIVVLSKDSTSNPENISSRYSSIKMTRADF